MDQDAVIAQEQSGHYVTMANFYMQRAASGLLDGPDERLCLQTERLPQFHAKG